MASHASIREVNFYVAVASMYFLSFATVIALSMVIAPYGRHTRTGWGPKLPARLSWIVMESPAIWFTAWTFSLGHNSGDLVPRVLLGFYIFHYWHRVVVYPLRARLRGKSVPVIVALLAFGYNVLNGYIQGYQISEFGQYPPEWLVRPQFLVGAAVFLVGFVTNFVSDSILFSLRSSDDDPGYKVPRGFLYALVSCPNYLGEAAEWLGWALMTWSAAGLAFFVYTCANLGPRALNHHHWYRRKFEDYPKNRRAIVPFLI